jgi:tetratricopeptide (TPR) repeat protein
MYRFKLLFLLSMVLCCQITYSCSKRNESKIPNKEQQASHRENVKLRNLLGLKAGRDMAAGQFDKALKLCVRMQKLCPEDPMPVFLYAWIIEHNGQRKKSLTFYKRAQAMYDSLGVDTNFSNALNRTACTQAIDGQTVFLKEIDHIRKKIKRGDYKDFPNRNINVSWIDSFANKFDYKKLLSYMGYYRQM